MPHKHTELQLTLFCSVDIGPGSGLKTLSTGEERGERREEKPESDFNTETDAEYEATIQKKQNRSYQLLCPTRNVLEQCPQMTRMPSGWCWGSGTSLLMWTDPKLIMRLLGREAKWKRNYFIWMLSKTANFEIIQKELQKSPFLFHFIFCSQSLHSRHSPQLNWEF